MEPRLNLFDPDHRKDPYPDYTRIRRAGPVCQVDPGGMWTITRYDSALYMLKNTDIFTAAGFKPVWEPPWLGYNPLANSILAMDPPKHTRLRNLVSRAFGPQVIARMESYVRSLAERLADNMRERGEVEFVDAFAMPLPGLTISSMLGLEPDMARHFQRWSNATTAASPVAPAPEVIVELRKSIDELCGYLREVIAARRLVPADDLVTDLLRAELEGQKLTETQLLEFLATLLAGGFETTINFLGLAVLRLSQHPEELTQLRADPTLIPKFVDEMMRYDPPGQAIVRMTTRDVELGGTTIPGGSVVLALVGSANRDESRFTDPERFDIQRGDVGLGFGHGAHYCIGASLARMEMRFGLEALVSRFRAFEVDPSQIQWKVALTLRGPTFMHVRAVV